jgi:sulfhydrogenase subunit delta
MTEQSAADEPRRPTLAVWKFSSCDGCQLTLLNCEDELLAVAGAVQIAYFPEATRAVVDGPYDLSLVEGSITTPEDVERIKEVRRVSRRLVTIGACATSGGIYAQPSYIDTLATSTPIEAHVEVDFQLRGCPVDPDQLLEVLAAFLQDRPARIPAYSVCVECKRHGNVCVTVAHGTPCLGPVTHAGCGALCPSFARGCYGCFGAKGTPNTASMADRLAALGMSQRDVGRVFRTFTAAAEPFRSEGARHLTSTQHEAEARS